MIDAVSRLAEELPDHQTSRGDEFRDLSMRDRERLARPLVLARNQAQTESGETTVYRRAMRQKRDRYFYIAGDLNIRMREAQTIWRGVVQ